MNDSDALEVHSGTRQDPSRDALTGRFLPGNSGNGGRRRGSRSKLAEAFIADVYDEYCEHGRDAIRRVREENPVAFVAMIVRLLPQKFEVEATSPLAGWTTDELRAFADDLKRWREGMNGTARPAPNGTAGQGGSCGATLAALPPLPSAEEVARAWAAASE